MVYDRTVTYFYSSCNKEIPPSFIIISPSKHQPENIHNHMTTDDNQAGRTTKTPSKTTTPQQIKTTSSFFLLPQRSSVSFLCRTV